MNSIAVEYLDCDHETEILLSRPRRETKDKKSIFDTDTDNVVQLEKLHDTIRTLEQKIADLEQKCEK